jgi:Pentapeptide repeats (8 copies)
MRVRATASSLLIAISFCLCDTLPTSAQQQKAWTWKARDGKVRSRADLDKLLEQHELWMDSKEKSGARADLSGADLSHADLRGTLFGADLRFANLSGAILRLADLSYADLSHADLSHADLSFADLSGADLSHADLFGAQLMFAKLRFAGLSDADLRAGLGATDLSGANLSGADLSGAILLDASLGGALFEPKNLPPSESIAGARGLEMLRYRDNPGPLTQLRKQFQDAGFREQERAITCALNRYAQPYGSAEGLFKWIAFDLTCEYGFSYGRPLLIVLLLWLFFSGVYAEFISRSANSGIYFVGTRWSRGRSNTQGIRIRPRAIHAAKCWKLPFLWLRREWRVLRAAMFFSLMSAFNIGFRDINFGRWLRLLTKREYDLKAVGWARTVSGLQSLLSVYLIALWVLSYFGRPFE